MTNGSSFSSMASPTSTSYVICTRGARTLEIFCCVLSLAIGFTPETDIALPSAYIDVKMIAVSNNRPNQHRHCSVMKPGEGRRYRFKAASVCLRCSRVNRLLENGCRKAVNGTTYDARNKPQQ